MTAAKTKAAPAATTETLRLTRRFKAPRAAVFRAWTDPKALADWFGPESFTCKKVHVDLRPGGRYSLEMHDPDGSVHPLSGVYREIKAPERLVFTWTWGGGDYGGVETLVTIELAEVKGGTELSLTHERLTNELARTRHRDGWSSSFTCLEEYLAK